MQHGKNLHRTEGDSIEQDNLEKYRSRLGVAHAPMDTDDDITHIASHFTTSNLN